LLGVLFNVEDEDSTNIMFLNIIYPPVFIYKHCPVYFSKYNISATGFCLSLKNNRMVFLDNDRT
jgi:hypothetical protein